MALAPMPLITSATDVFAYVNPITCPAVGYGTYGHVVALPTHTNRVVKRMDDGSPNEEIASSTLREMVFLTSLQPHPAIIRIHSIGMDLQKPCITMDHGGMTLLTFMEQFTEIPSFCSSPSGASITYMHVRCFCFIYVHICTLSCMVFFVASVYIDTVRVVPLPIIRRVMVQLLDGIAHCHAHNIAHRDIKFTNVLVDPVMNVRLIDFGIACPGVGASSAAPMPHTDSMASLGFRAPEMLLDPCWRGYDPFAIDMWSAGVILLGLLLGDSVPLGSSSIEQCLARIAELVPVQQHDSSVVGGGPATTQDNTTALMNRLRRVLPDLSRRATAIYPLDARLEFRYRAALSSCDPELSAALDLVLWLLAWLPTARPSAAQARQHRFFVPMLQLSVTPSTTVTTLPWNATARLWLSQDIDDDYHGAAAAHGITIVEYDNHHERLARWIEIIHYRMALRNGVTDGFFDSRSTSRLAHRLLDCYLTSRHPLKTESGINDFFIPLCCWTLADRFYRSESERMDHVASWITGSMDDTEYLVTLEIHVFSVLLATTTTAVTASP